MIMLGIIVEILPVGSDDWPAVLEAHLVDFPLLCRKKIPTAGDPRCPSKEVKLGKRIKHNIS
jgi:hypothetical protein